MSLQEFESTRDDALKAASSIADPYLRTWAKYVAVWEEFHRGRTTHAHEAALELMQIGRETGDPRSTGQGLSILAVNALLSDNYALALDYCEQAMSIATTPLDHQTGFNGKGCALILLKRVEEGVAIIEEFQGRCKYDGNVYSLNLCGGIYAISKAMRGNIGQATAELEGLIAIQDREGYRTCADWYRNLISELYLQVLEGKEKAPLSILLKNLPTIIRIRLTARRRIMEWTTEVRRNPRFDPNGSFIGRCEMILGLLYKAKKKTGLAVRHLTEARRITAQWGPTPMLARIDAALTELSTAT
jgi:hypothetical protein